MEARECARFNLQPQLPRTTAGEGNFGAKTPMCCRPTTTTIVVVACPDRVSWSPESNQLLFWQITISEFWKKTAKFPPDRTEGGEASLTQKNTTLRNGI